MDLMSTTSLQIGLIGYGEVGRILAEELRARQLSVIAHDIRQTDGQYGTVMQEHARAHGVKLVGDACLAAAGSWLLISAVTASQTLPAVSAIAEGIEKGAFVLDLNSASPGTKIEAASRTEAGGGRYVEGAVMTSVPPHRIKVPLLLGGPHAAALAPTLESLGFVPTLGSERFGVASATKMCRSVMIKGLEAMVMESFTAARHYGVEDDLVASLQETFPEIDWNRLAAYLFQRVIEHGRRRSEEMFESANTVRECGMPAFLAQATAERQAWVAGLADRGVFGERGAAGFARSADWRTEADRLCRHLAEQAQMTSGSAHGAGESQVA